MALIPPFMMDCVVAIGFPDSQNNVVFVGTGFLFGRLLPNTEPSAGDRYQVFLVTNRHVVAGQHVAYLRFNPKAPSPAHLFSADLLEPNGDPIWFGHPDPEVDIAVLMVEGNQLRDAKIQFNFFCGDKHVMTHPEALRDGLSEGDGVFVLGFPMGNVGVERNYVVVRQGAIARIRDSLMGAVKDFLIDATVFPGNSGGPVITRPEIASITGTTSINRAVLIGVVAAYLPYNDVAISQQTRRPRIIFEENSGLTSVVPIDRVVEVVERAYAKFASVPGKAPAPEPPGPGAPAS